jgi:hypothetical protein
MNSVGLNKLLPIPPFTDSCQLDVASDICHLIRGLSFAPDALPMTHFKNDLEFGEFILK